jgi:hypothetical protein
MLKMQLKKLNIGRQILRKQYPKIIVTLENGVVEMRKEKSYPLCSWDIFREVEETSDKCCIH